MTRDYTSSRGWSERTSGNALTATIVADSVHAFWPIVHMSVYNKHRALPPDRTRADTTRADRADYPTGGGGRADVPIPRAAAE